MPSDFWHRVGVYFGVADEREDGRRAREERSPPTLRRSLFGRIGGATAGGAFFGVIDGSTTSGIASGAFLALAFTAEEVWERRKLASPDRPGR